MDNLDGKNAVLTGATQGIGPRVAEALAREGVNLLLIAPSQRELKELSAELEGRDVEIEVAAADINDPQERRNIPKRARSAFGQIDILVNNAATEEMGSFAEQDEAGIARIVETNVAAPMLITREILPPMLQRNAGHVVNVASLAGRLGLPRGAVYAGTKAALIEWSLSLNAELHESAVNVSVVCAGFLGDQASGYSGGKPLAPVLRPVDPEHAAQTVITAIKKNRPEIIPTAVIARPMMVLRAISPTVADWLDRKLGLLTDTGGLAP